MGACLWVAFPGPGPAAAFGQDVGGDLLQSAAFHKSGEFAGAGTDI